MPEPGLLIGGLVAMLLSLLAYALGYRRSARRRDLITEVPTIAARDIPGLGAAMVEVKGIAVADEPLISDLARIPCVAFSSQVTEHWTTTRTERDSKGKTRVVTDHHSETRHANDGRIDFLVRDDGGAVLVRPDGADMDMLDGMGDMSGPLPESPAYAIRPRHFGGRLRYSETVLPVHQRLYVLGQVSMDHAICRPEGVDRPFIISYRDEKQLLSSATWGVRIWGVLMIVLFLAGFFLAGVGGGLVASPFEREPTMHRYEHHIPLPAERPPPGLPGDSR